MPFVPVPRCPGVHPTTARRPAPPHTRIRVLRGLSGGRDAWAERSARITGLLVAVGEAEAAGARLPAPLTGRRALWAWARTAEPATLAALPQRLCRAAFVVDPDDVATLAAAGRVLAGVLRAARGGPAPGCGAGAGDALVHAVHREARWHDIAAEHLVAELGRAARLLTEARPRPVPRCAPAGGAAS